MTRRYRSRVPVMLGLIMAAALLAVGSTMAVPEPRVNVVQQLLGVMVIGLAGFIGAVAITSMVKLTPAGIAHRRNFRLQTIPWESVKSFRIAPVPQTPFWSTVLVEMRPTGDCYLISVSGSRRYIERVIADFEDYRAKLAAAQDSAPPG